MIDSIYKNAFGEVYYILQNTEDELIEKIPQKFINFLQDNMNKDYNINISTNIEIDKQKLLPETENILALIYRSYWATSEEKQEFSIKDSQELKKIEEQKKAQYKDIDEIFAKKNNIKNVTLDNNLAIIPKESFIQKLLKKLLKFFKR